MTSNVSVDVNSSSISLNQNTPTTEFTRKYIELIYIVVCSTQIIIGLVCNIISLKVFMRSGKCSPIILQRHSLILLTLSNTFYLIVFFYSQILPKLVVGLFLEESTKEFLSKIYISNHSVFVCKFVQYFINVAICLNVSITTSFSLERAFAIKFPYLSINLRENHDVQFKILILSLLLFSFLLPSYNLFLVTIVDVEERCSVHKPYSTIYFYLTVLYVLFTILLPFLIISFSNYTIIKEIVKVSKNRAFGQPLVYYIKITSLLSNRDQLINLNNVKSSNFPPIARTKAFVLNMLKVEFVTSDFWANSLRLASGNNNFLDQ